MPNYNKKTGDTSCRIGEVRFSYASVFSKRKNSDGTEGKYSVCVIIPKSNTQAYNLLEECYENAKIAGKTSKWGGKVPAKVSLPIHDGDEEKPEDPAFENCWYFNCSGNRAPGVAVREADGSIVAALDEEDFYSGCYGAVTVNLYPYAASGNNGVAIGLNNVIKTRDGEKLSGGARSAEQDFADL